MDFLKFKKKRDEPLDLPMPTSDMQPTGQGPPVEQVSMMRQQGYTDNQIAQALQSQGYEQNQIYDAMGQVPTYANSMETGMSNYGEQYKDYSQTQSSPSFTPSSQSFSAPMSFDDERIQEVAEAIIDEKWEDFVKDIKKVIEWKEKSEERLTRIEQQILDMRMGIDALTKSILSKIQGYDQNIVDVGTEIKAMEKVFQKVLPSLTENVNKLERMSKGYSEPKGFSDPFMRR